MGNRRIMMPKKIGTCNDCMSDAPYTYCCKCECGQHEFCRDCTAKCKGVTNSCPRGNRYEIV